MESGPCGLRVFVAPARCGWAGDGGANAIASSRNSRTVIAETTVLRFLGVPLRYGLPGISADEGEVADLMSSDWFVMRSANQFARTNTVAAHLLGKKVTELRCTPDQWRNQL